MEGGRERRGGGREWEEERRGEREYLFKYIGLNLLQGPQSHTHIPPNLYTTPLTTPIIFRTTAEVANFKYCHC